MEGLLPEHLAGAVLTGAILPDDIAKFEALGQVAAISSEARKIFIGLLAACVYSWLVIGTTKDVALIFNTASSPLPIINAPIPITGFYVVGATLLAAVYCYFHFYLQRFVADARHPARGLPGWRTQDDKTDPWQLTNLVRAEFEQLRATAPPLTRLENLLSIVLAWWLVPVTLFALWARYLPAHDLSRHYLARVLIGATALFGRYTFRLARATLRGEAPAAGRRAAVGRGAVEPRLRELRRIRPERLIVWFLLPFLIMVALSISALPRSPRDAEGNVAVYSLSAPEHGLGNRPTPAKLLNFVRIPTYADLREVELAPMPPEDWDGKDWGEIKRVELRDRELGLRRCHERIPRQCRPARRDVDRRPARLRAAAGRRPQGGPAAGCGPMACPAPGRSPQPRPSSSAPTSPAPSSRAPTSARPSSGAPPSAGPSSRAPTSRGPSSRALTSARPAAGRRPEGRPTAGCPARQRQPPGRLPQEAQLQGADLRGAQLQGADLTRPSSRAPTSSQAQLQGADLRKTRIWRARVNDALWDLADLRASSVQPMTKSDIDALISEATRALPTRIARKAGAETLNAMLRTEKRSPRPEFPERMAIGAERDVRARRSAARAVRLGSCASGPRNRLTTRTSPSSSVISLAAATWPRRRPGASPGARSTLRGRRSVRPLLAQALRRARHRPRLPAGQGAARQHAPPAGRARALSGSAAAASHRSLPTRSRRVKAL